jgi:hypothetical protein
MMKLLANLAIGAAMLGGLAVTSVSVSTPADAAVYVRVGPGWHHGGWCRWHRCGYYRPGVVYVAPGYWWHGRRWYHRSWYHGYWRYY